jgi:RNA polymerase sigma-70 factor (ECF subfamily)
MPPGDGARTRRFEAVALPHLPAAYNLARWICRNEADAADVVQEAVMRALQYFDSYHGGDARAWLLQIVRNSAYTWIGKNRLSGQVALDELETDTAAMAQGRWSAANPGPEDPMTTVVAEDESARLRLAIARLPVDQREILVLREFEAMSYRQIAGITGCPIGTVMSRLSRARDQLALIVRGEPGASS